MLYALYGGPPHILKSDLYSTSTSTVRTRLNWRRISPKASGLKWKFPTVSADDLWETFDRCQMKRLAPVHRSASAWLGVCRRRRGFELRNIICLYYNEDEVRRTFFFVGNSPKKIVNFGEKVPNECKTIPKRKTFLNLNGEFSFGGAVQTISA